MTLCGVIAATRKFVGPASDPRLDPGAAEGAASSIAISAAAAQTAVRAKGQGSFPTSDRDGASAPGAKSPLVHAAAANGFTAGDAMSLRFAAGLSS